MAIPLTFEENRGQADHVLSYVANTGRGMILLSDKEIILSAGANDSQPSVRMHLLRGAKTKPTGEDPTSGFANYYRFKR